MLQLVNGADVGGREPLGGLGVAAVAGDTGERLDIAACCRGFTHEHQCSSTIGDSRGTRRGDAAVLGEGRSQGRDFIQVAVEGLLILVHPLLATPAFDLKGHDLRIEGARLDRTKRPAY